ncbi:Leucine-, isoleucine-, valine-, threonine-, and alanine-binding protein [wastewater metagenome]|uniref:Leucine-, isoleucine-, valine-, threonine-, and alanine-binding protein n=4 Tax=root TaxID=1 RepID=A0A5B8R8L5_9ZZZZ|nr:ABC transporter substrate-binding protein [Arhodomonas aquaeolei]MCS4502733.1 ABC transporter substrate-binding protein [Arhodomonas aquaeolei]QEA03784.1 leucine-, isoleucine-, valine-, threonine-, and alanine-binding protein [uncultured organism]
MFRRLAIGFALGLCSLTVSAPLAAKEPVRIGGFMPVTGPASFLGDPEKKTLELYVDRLNEAGGVLGRQLELVAYDTGGSAAKARTFAKRLISADQVDVVIGGLTGSTMAVMPLMKRGEMPFISLSGSVAPIEPTRSWIFKTPQTDRMAAARVFDDMSRRGIERIGLLSGSGGFGSSGRKQSLAIAEAHGIEVVADETYAPKDTDMSAQLTSIANTEGVQAIFVFGFGQGPAIVTRNYHQLGLELPLYQSHGVASDKFIELAGENAAEGVRLPAPPLLVADQLPADDPQKTVLMDYKAAYEGRYGEPASTFGGYAYDALHLYVRAVRKAGTTARPAVRDALETVSDYVGVTGIFNLGSDDHMGLDRKTAFRMAEIHDGQWRLID